MIQNIKTACLIAAAMATSSFAGTAPSGKAPMPVSEPACSPEISYNNIGLNWNHAFIDAAGVDDVDSAGIDFSALLVDRLYFRGKAYYSDAGNSGWSDWSASAGLGYSVPMCDKTNLVAEAGGLFDDQENGFYIYPHVRAKFGCLEIHAGAKYSDYEGGYQEWEGVANLFYEVMPNVDLNVGGLFAEDVNTLQVGVRYKF